MNSTTAEMNRLEVDRGVAQRRVKELEEALGLAADTFTDFRKAFTALQKVELAVACGIAEQSCLAVLGPRS